MSKKTEAELLKEQLMMTRKHGIYQLDEDKVKEADEFCEPYKKIPE